ncbi:HsmA family protein [Clostridium oryzae]|uniref:TIGR03987 family protein n=1 Tax=Clostridium oryzae TaxID=1450648 RepID=A0A1V4IYD5_9CLOT|nr:HsmA family protein [Clostridium oryzae]OPJ64774.1 hypothetical protein CLORY_02830 [Clostridium oryzae]
MLVFAVIFVTLALVFYTVGIWSEKRHGQLEIKHLLFLCAGLVFDVTGTILMSKLSDKGFELNLHGIIGIVGILLMAVTVIYAVVVLAIKNDKARKNFSKFSVVVWLIWLLSYLSGMMIGI